MIYMFNIISRSGRCTFWSRSDTALFRLTPRTNHPEHVLVRATTVPIAQEIGCLVTIRDLEALDFSDLEGTVVIPGRPFTGPGPGGVLPCLGRVVPVSIPARAVRKAWDITTCR